MRDWPHDPSRIVTALRVFSVFSVADLYIVVGA